MQYGAGEMMSHEPGLTVKLDGRKNVGLRESRSIPAFFFDSVGELYTLRVILFYYWIFEWVYEGARKVKISLSLGSINDFVRLDAF